MKRVIVGTAGHIDHGKTTLVKALTGIETDRLKEERQRGISIELGFAPFNLPDGQKAAIVDVPGHERFIRHMLAGAFGIDMVLFTIAADEGVMPQTREHMDIIELLGVNKGIVVITKKDMVDEEWLMLVEEEIREYIDQSILKGSPMIAVSALTREGIPELLDMIAEVAGSVVEKPVFGQARLPIDRVFSMAGFGTVVTGTLWSGQINVGDTLELMPVQKNVKVRTLQVHNEKLPSAYAGQRVAVNIQGIEVGDIKRGYLLASSGYLEPSYRVNTRLRLLKSSARSLKNWNRIRFHLGTDETLGRVVLLDRDELLPGEEAYAQIVMEKPIVAYKGDPFVIRYYSPVNTIGGGSIIDPNAPRQKRFREEVLNDLAVKEEGSLYDVVLHEIESAGQEPLTIQEIMRRTGSSEDDIKIEVQQLLDDDKVVDVTGKGGYYFSSLGIDRMAALMDSTMREYLSKFPLRAGYPKEDMRSRLFNNLNSKVFTALLKYFEENGQLSVKNNLIAPYGYHPQPGDRDKQMIAEINRTLEQNFFSPPGLDEIEALQGLPETDLNEIISYLLDKGEIIKLSENIYFAAAAIEKGKDLLEAYFEQEKELSLATARDLFNTSRKYALPLVEYYDKIRFTRRVGDMRIKA
ncbi:Translation elongation factor, selenocysteine-specific [Syntrophomonas zehnderi OL-4]|uniref:Selenocysteine-specific elongation factor n=1 Tax=Syntrophomonas zehnderi OL-4 TaxID=690567 RepID=A0A0E4C7E9_9FIRM|nr:selenocysteine-specific translation elongation factor [Syntrophomonas zehnderi]CFW99049.1 Translation elongation factor, selenocysteine-specific [Syntrophomonas zehnderi OL-4]